MNPTEICEYLAYYITRDYAQIKFSNCIYHESRDELVTTFLYDSNLTAERLDELKPRLEQEYQSAVGAEAKYSFVYRKSFIDEIMLSLQVHKLLRSEFSILTLDLAEDDVQVKQTADGFTVNLYLPKHTIEYVRQSKAYNKFIAELCDNNFCSFNFFINEKIGGADSLGTLEKLEQYMQSTLREPHVKVDKTIKVKNVEYFLGKPIKERPIKIEFLKISPDEQIIAGRISYLTRREYIRKAKQDGGEGASAAESEPATETKPYFTFVLDDGANKQQCVFFPTQNTLSKFEKLADGIVVCAVGLNSERNGRVSFRVNGISLCEMA